MGLFNKLMGGGNASDSNLEWNPLTDSRQLDEILEESKQQTIAIYKHSTRCGISRMVLKGFESDFDLNSDQVKLYFLDLLKYRGVSNDIASKYGVYHESPQLIVLKDGAVIYHTSHGSIRANKLSEFI
ncbi:bacillithiol system redox-active protein YtxJ [Flavobacteriaceae bacterium R38]|nr:bacillithiol system redox-active protein YtxJ [Flavobacteriaceae bacterium R38]